MNASFWDQRVARLGHTGWANPALYAHDQPLRLAAIEKALRRIRAPTGAAALDIGCGTGDVAAVLAQRGFQVTAIDVSPRVIGIARQRDTRAIDFQVASIEDFPGPDSGFDLVTSVTVLQHLTEPARLARALRNLGRVLRPGGHLLLLESVRGQALDHVAPRTAAEWVRSVEVQGFHRVRESSYPQAAITLAAWRVRARRPPLAHRDNTQSRRATWAQRALLAGAWPLDHLLRVPTPAAVAPYRLFTFVRGDVMVERGAPRAALSSRSRP